MRYDEFSMGSNSNRMEEPCLLIFSRYALNVAQFKAMVTSGFFLHFIRLVTISQGTARNHFWEAGMLMQSSILDIVQ